MLQQHRSVRAERQCIRAQPSVIVRCSFNFADSQRVKQQTPGRRNRQAEKRQEQELRSIVHGLCAFNNKQLQAVAHLLSDVHVAQIKVAMDIPPTNQGRRRQEGLVAKLLRAELDTLALDKLSEAVNVAQRNKLPYSDADVEQQLQLWIQGLQVNDQDIVDEVHSLLQKHSLDWQQFRTWVRQLQQQQALPLQQEQDIIAVAASPHQASDLQAAAAAAGIAPEVQQLMLALAEHQVPGKQRSGGGKKASAARRAIRNVLKPLAVAMHTA